MTNKIKNMMKQRKVHGICQPDNSRVNQTVNYKLRQR